MAVEAPARVENPETLQNTEFARILRQHGIKIKEAQQALRFFCGNNWGLVKNLNINADRADFPIRHNVTFSERSPIGIMRRKSSFAFLEGMTYAKVGFAAEEFDFINFQIGSLFGIFEVHQVTSIELAEDTLEVSGSRSLAVDSEGKVIFQRHRDTFTEGEINEGFLLDSSGHIRVWKEADLPSNLPDSDFETIRLSQALGVGTLNFAGDKERTSSLYLNLGLVPSGIQLVTTRERTEASFAVIEEEMRLSAPRAVKIGKSFSPL